MTLILSKGNKGEGVGSGVAVGKAVGLGLAVGEERAEGDKEGVAAGELLGLAEGTVIGWQLQRIPSTNKANPCFTKCLCISSTSTFSHHSQLFSFGK